MCFLCVTNNTHKRLQIDSSTLEKRICFTFFLSKWLVDSVEVWVMKWTFAIAFVVDLFFFASCINQSFSGTELLYQVKEKDISSESYSGCCFLISYWALFLPWNCDCVMIHPLIFYWISFSRSVCLSSSQYYIASFVHLAFAYHFTTWTSSRSLVFNLTLQVNKFTSTFFLFFILSFFLLHLTLVMCCFFFSFTILLRMSVQLK